MLSVQFGAVHCPLFTGLLLIKILFFIRCDKYGAVDAYDAIYLDLYLNGYLDTL